MSTVSPLLNGLLKDAAVFPPRNLPLPAALVAHAHHRGAWYGDLVGPFVCPASRLDELAQATDGRPDAAPAEVVVVLDAGTGAAPAAVERVDAAGLRLRGLELPLRGDDLTGAAKRAVLALDDVGAGEEFAGTVEIPRAYAWRDALAVVADAGYAAKLRLGGPHPHDVPPADDVAGFVLACLDLGAPFTFTAGLHHAVADLVPAAGATPRHGFLNVLVATWTALDGGQLDDVTADLARPDGEALAARAAVLDGTQAVRIRRWFLDLGTCGIDEPVHALRALGLLAAP